MLDLLTSKNGVPAIFIHKQSETSHLVIHFNHGSSSDPEGLEGAVHLLEHMLFKGTETRSYLDLICGIEHLGADLNAFTTKESMVLHVSCPDDSLNDVMLFMADIVNNSRFDEKELQKEKRVIADEIKSYRDTPAEFIYDEYEKMMFNGNALGHPILGSVASLRRIDALTLKKVYDLVCSNYHIALVSRRNPSEIVELLDQHFLAPKPQPVNHRSPVKMARPKSKTLRDDVSQYHVIVGCHGPSYRDKNHLTAQLLASFLGGNAMSALLNLELREKKGLTYTVETALQAYADSGLFYTYFTCDKNREKQTLKRLHALYQKYALHGLDASELAVQKRMMRSQYHMFFEQALNEALFQAKHFQYCKQLLQPDELLSQIENIQLDEINEMASQMLSLALLSTLKTEMK